LPPYKYHFTEKESDITIISDSRWAIKEAKSTFLYHRGILERYIQKHEAFKTSFSPIKISTEKKIIKMMSDASFICNVGPMATVAGALADLMVDSMNKIPPKDEKGGKEREIKIKMVENGGELSIDSEDPLNVGLFAGKNPLNMNIGFRIKKKDCPIGIGTSSATVGHAVSLGESDAVTIFADNATIADGGATMIGNIVKGKDIEKSIKAGLDLSDDSDWIRGVFISREDKVGYSGNLPEIIKITGDSNLILRGNSKSIMDDGDLDAIE
jgi:hypothetical protein